MESPLRGNTHGGFGERPGETDPEQSGHRAPGRLHCDLASGGCDAHHIVPWWEGGRTALSNLLLLCRSHHGVLEPARYGVRDQWTVRIADDGLPEFLPPARYGPDRAPMRNRRTAPFADTG